MTSKHPEGTHGWYEDVNYNPQYGDKHNRVRKEDFSIDGRPWAYRAPNNYNSKSRDASKAQGDDDYNEHSYTWTNPLYDYSFGQVRDAAKTLGIGNVNKEEEVTSIIDHIQNGSKKQEEKKIQTVKKPEPTEKKEDYMVDVTEQEKQSKNFADSLNKSVMGNTPSLSPEAVNPTAGMKADTPAQQKASNMAFNAVNNLKEKGLQLSSKDKTLDQRKPGANDFYDRDAFDEYVSQKKKDDENNEEEN